MNLVELVSNKLGWLNPKVAEAIENKLRKIPFFNKEMEKEYGKIMGELEESMKPYRKDFTTYDKFPEVGVARTKVLKDMRRIASMEEERWKDGYVSGAVYHGNAEHIAFLNKIYALYSQSNPLHSDLWPSASKFEAEIISMTANMLGASNTGGTEEICGAVSSGGTESILLAMKTYRDRARAEKGITKPEMILPTTAHAAFDKAAHYFGIKQVRIPVGRDCRADVAAAEKAINKNTIVIIGSAPAFPHGVIDPIKELSELAFKNDIGFHTDACLGGFILPWAEKLGYYVPGFDFRLPGVTSISADTHKYGYTAKGTSVILYRSPELRQYQYYTTTEWPGGMYFSPTFAGSRSGALSAVCWACLVSIGEQGYLDATKKIMETADKIKKAIVDIPDLHIVGNPMWVIAFASETLDIFRIMEYMTKKKWNLNGLHKPSCVHIAVTLRHTEEGVVERFIDDLREVVAYVKANPKPVGEGMPVYGMAASLPFRGMIGEMLKRYMDLYYKV